MREAVAKADADPKTSVAFWSWYRCNICQPLVDEGNDAIAHEKEKAKVAGVVNKLALYRAQVRRRSLLQRGDWRHRSQGLTKPLPLERERRVLRVLRQARILSQASHLGLEQLGGQQPRLPPRPRAKGLLRCLAHSSTVFPFS